MNKAELISAVAERTGMKKKDTEAVIKAFTDVIAEELQADHKVSIVGFGTFEVTERAERTGKNPQTGEDMVIGPSRSPKFRAGKVFKDAIR